LASADVTTNLHNLVSVDGLTAGTVRVWKRPGMEINQPAKKAPKPLKANG